jgi:nucleotide-binding universal stress UspA family protein
MIERNVHDMKKGFAKILVAIDGSQASINAAERAISLAKKYDARLTGVFVVPSNIGYGYLDEDTLSEWPAEIRRVVSNIITKGEGYLDSIKKRAIDNAVQFDSEVILGGSSVVRAIIEYAEKNDIELIVMGTIGISGFKRLLLGSTASGVVTYSHCPVLLVK